MMAASLSHCDYRARYKNKGPLIAAVPYTMEVLLRKSVLFKDGIKLIFEHQAMSLQAAKVIVGNR